MPTITPDYLASHGVSNAEALLAGHKRLIDAGLALPLALALAMTELESYKNKNVYGHDAGGYFNVDDEEFAHLGVPLFPGSSIKVLYVTEENFDEYYKAVIILKRKANGVGPGQITWAGRDNTGGYLLEAKTRGLKLWSPEDNDYFSFEKLAGHLKGRSVEDAAKLYRYGDTSHTDPENYAGKMVAAMQRWEKILAEVPAPVEPTPLPDPVPAPEPTPEPTPDFTKVRVLRYGSRGMLVLRMANKLESLGFEVIGKNSKYFSRQVEGALMRYQAARGLRVDGIAGPQTWGALFVDGFDARAV